jgi:CRP/FNR family transcriptional regulator, cyclic AMP receptor protein
VTVFVPSSNSTRTLFIAPRARTRHRCPFLSGRRDRQNQTWSKGCCGNTPRFSPLDLPPLPLKVGGVRDVESAQVGDHVEHLRSVGLFAALDDSALERVAECATEVDVRQGTLLTERGQPGSGMFVIVDGHARVELPGRRVELGPGDVVGELSLLTDDWQRSARVAAATDIRCLAIARDDFARLLENDPRIAVPLLRVLAERLRGMIEAA